MICVISGTTPDAFKCAQQRTKLSDTHLARGYALHAVTQISPVPYLILNQILVSQTFFSPLRGPVLSTGNQQVNESQSHFLDESPHNQTQLTAQRLNQHENKTFNSSSSPGSPTLTSSPRLQRENTTASRNDKKLKLLNVNCQSAMAKKLPLTELIQTNNPDIVTMTETWLTDQHKNCEMLLSSTYSIYRRDRVGDAHGGVLIAIKDDLISTRADQFESNCEILWCQIYIPGRKTIQVGAYYRPHEGDEDSLNELEKSLDLLNKDHHIVLAGDMNFPGWDWKNQELKSCNSR